MAKCNVCWGKGYRITRETHGGNGYGDRYTCSACGGVGEVGPYEVRFMDGPMRNKTVLVKNYREPFVAYKNVIVSNDLSNIQPIAPFTQVEYHWDATLERSYSDGRPSTIIYEMRVKK